MSIDGLVSGIDSTAIVTQLMQIERQPGVLMQSRQDVMKAAVAAFDSVASKMSTLGTAAAALQRSSGWGARSASSTDPSVATVTATDGALISSLSFTVERVAKAHGVAAGADVATIDSAAASGGSVTLTIGATAHPLSVGAGSLSDVIDAVNNAGLGVRAAAVNTGAGYRLQLTASSTGAASAFTIDGLDPGLGGTVVTTTGVDAQIKVGDGVGSYSLSSATNSFADVVPGVNVRAVSVSSNPVTITVNADPAVSADKVGALVDAANSVLAEIAMRTAYDTSSKRGSSLTGDSTVARLRQEIVRAVVGGAGSSVASPGAVGVSVDRDGKITFDRDKFTAAFTLDPQSVSRVFTQGATTTGDVAFVGAADRTPAGTYLVDVSTAPGPGVDAVGTIGGLAAVGQGSLLTVPANTVGDASGLTVRLTGAATGPVGSLTYEPGLAQRFASIVAAATNSTDGSITGSKSARQASADALQLSINSFEARMVKRQAALKKEYAALEVALGNLRNQSNWLSGQLGQLSANANG